MTSILLVSPFAPQRDGIATYAAQELQQLRLAGHKVDVASPLGSAAHHHVPLGGPSGVLKLAQLASGYDRTILQFGPEMLFGKTRTAASRAAVWAAIVALAHACALDLRIHELEYDVLAKSSIERSAAKRAVQAADRITVHTEAEANQLASTMGIARSQVEVIEHGAHFVSRTTLTQAQAKRAVGIDPNRFAFVSIGFLQHHKGFDVAAEAMLAANAPIADLHIVGSRRVSHPDINRYVDQLEQLCSLSPQLCLHERFVSDDEFDHWVRAADVVVLPYREIWSSGVIERAQVLGTQVIAADLPQLKQQANGDALLVSDIDDLRAAMEQLYAAANYSDTTPINRSELASATGLDVEPVSSNVVETWGQAPLSLDLVQTQVESRARAALVSSKVSPDGALPSNVASNRAISSGHLTSGDLRRPLASDPLVSLAGLQRPHPVSARPGASRAKRVVLRLIDWQLAPIVQHIEDLQRATTEAIVRLERGQAPSTTDPIDVTDSASVIEANLHSRIDADDRPQNSRSMNRRATDEQNRSGDSGSGDFLTTKAVRPTRDQ